MGLFRRSSTLISNALRCYSSKISTVPNFRIPTVRQYSQPIFRNSINLHNGKNPFFDMSKRFYNVNRNQELSCYGKLKLLYYISAIALFFYGISFTLYYGTFDTVPGLKRRRLMVCSTSLERRLGAFHFKQVGKKYEGKILPNTHPDSIRVQKITQEIAGSIQRVLDESQTAHLKGLEWEAIVVDKPEKDRIYSIPGGKIVIYTGLLNEYCSSDDEIAIVIGHEVGHLVARHYMELFTNEVVFVLFFPMATMYLLMKSLMLLIANEMSAGLIRLPDDKRIELEADSIGLNLLACAGYDPRLAPEFYKKHYELETVFSTHPSGKNRAKALANPKVMEEALKIYREASH